MLAKRPLLSVLIAIVVLLGYADQAAAGRQWCKSDPGFVVAGTHVMVDVAVPWADQERVVGAVQVVLYVPKGIAAAAVFTDDGFGGRGDVASVAVSNRLHATAHGVQIVVAVTVPASGTSLLVNVVVTPDQGRSGSANGNANRQITVGSAAVSAT
jgi:hypothetical protein